MFSRLACIAGPYTLRHLRIRAWPTMRRRLKYAVWRSGSAEPASLGTTARIFSTIPGRRYTQPIRAGKPTCLVGPEALEPRPRRARRATLHLDPLAGIRYRPAQDPAAEPNDTSAKGCAHARRRGDAKLQSARGKQSAPGRTVGETHHPRRARRRRPDGERAVGLDHHRPRRLLTRSYALERLEHLDPGGRSYRLRPSCYAPAHRYPSTVGHREFRARRTSEVHAVYGVALVAFEESSFATSMARSPCTSCSFPAASCTRSVRSCEPSGTRAFMAISAPGAGPSSCACVEWQCAPRDQTSRGRPVAPPRRS